jgi:hypothetical protein
VVGQFANPLLNQAIFCRDLVPDGPAQVIMEWRPTMQKMASCAFSHLNPLQQRLCVVIKMQEVGRRLHAKKQSGSGDG